MQTILIRPQVVALAPRRPCGGFIFHSQRQLCGQLCVQPHSRHKEVACKAAAAADGAGGQEARAAGSQLLQHDPHQLAQLLQQLAELQVRPHQQWLSEVLATLEPQLCALQPAELASLVQVLGQWGVALQDSFVAQLHLATQQQLRAGRLQCRHISTMLWGLAQLSKVPKHAQPHQPLLQELLGAAGSLLAAGSSSGSQPDPLPPASLADLVWAVAKLQHHPGDAWMSSFCAAALPRLPLFTPHQLSQTIWGFARLQPCWQPGEAFLAAFYEAVTANLADFDSSSVSLCAWGLATLKATPSTRFLFSFERQAELTLSSLQAAELACTLWALSELKRKRPDQLRLGRLVRRQEVFHGYDHQLLANFKLLRVVRSLIRN